MFFKNLFTHQLNKSIKQAIFLHRTMTTKPDFVTVSYVTTPNETVARDLSRKLIEQRLAACVNIIRGVESIYEWKGKVEQDNELLLVIKSNSSKSEALAKFVESAHPFDCPEVVTLKVESGSAAYLEWVHSTVNQEALPSGTTGGSRD